MFRTVTVTVAALACTALTATTAQAIPAPLDGRQAAGLVQAADRKGDAQRPPGTRPSPFRQPYLLHAGMDFVG